MTSLPSIAIIIPTYNEVKNLAAMVTELRGLALPALNIIVVDDNSPDGTGPLADALAKKPENRMTVIHRPGKLGFGTAYLAGFEVALAQHTDAVAQIDCDFSHPPSALVPMAKLLADADVVIGSRYTPGGGEDNRADVGRKFLSHWARFYVRVILGLKPYDPTSGFKLWRREALIGVDLKRIQSKGIIFLVEMAYLAQRLGYRVIEYPIHFEDRRVGESKMSMGVKTEAAWRVWQLWFWHHRLSPKDRAVEP